MGDVKSARPDDRFQIREAGISLDTGRMYQRFYAYSAFRVAFLLFIVGLAGLFFSRATKLLLSDSTNGYVVHPDVRIQLVRGMGRHSHLLAHQVAPATGSSLELQA